MKKSQQRKNRSKEKDCQNDATAKEREKKTDHKKKKDDKLDRELKESFPASDPPSSIQPGNDVNRD